MLLFTRCRRALNRYKNAHKMRKEYVVAVTVFTSYQ